MKIATPARVVRLLRDRLAATGDAGRTITLDALVHDILPYPVVRAALGLAGKAEYDLALLRLLENRTYLQVDPAVVDAVSEELERLEPGLEFVEEWSDSLLRLRRLDLGPLAEEDEGESEARSAVAADPGGAADSAAASAGDPETDEVPPRGRPRAGPADGRTKAGPASPEAVTAPAPPLDRAEPVDPAPVEAPASDSTPPVAPPVSGDEAAAAGVVESAPEAEAPAPEAPTPTRCWSCGGRLPARESVLYCPQCGTGQRDRRCAACGDRVEPDWRFCVRCGRGLAHP